MRSLSYAILAASALSLAACAGPSDSPFDRQGRYLSTLADPGKLVATDIAFSRAARDSGQWTAYREYAADDAVMFVPDAVNAREWLAQQENPATPLQWQPHQVWSSCDGTLAVTRGAWQIGQNRNGQYLTVWRRQDDNSYKWVQTQADTVDAPLTAPDMVQTTVADCATGEEDPSLALQAANASAQDRRMRGSGQLYDNSSRDNTLFLNMFAEADMARHWTLYVMEGGQLTEVLRGDIPAPRN
ncbi:nuclear transport factor 2 family protein [Erythrobacter litoralis]|uniref:DUF4440 domain-containing protein n=1 Tax=Erythrobacter litoralis TaxID=39960 RepID=UPI0024353E96|nr:DUF4440 domain-containing protein [Erythrobacter litoralis]MDG6079213.1 nuclear transport factor 2 family protein [Erythrobacter litoralis]